MAPTDTITTMPVNEAPTDYMARLRLWITAGPLRKWRKDNRISLHEVASAINVTVTTIQKWESGGLPTQDNLELLSRLVGDNNFIDTWLDWQGEKPTL